MTRYFIHYWKNVVWTEMAETLSTYLAGKVARTGDNRFTSKGIMPNDHVYIVTILDGKLVLGGKIIVDKILPHAKAQLYEDWGYPIYEAETHLVMPINQSGYFTPDNFIPVNIVKKLEFISHKAKKLKFIDKNRLYKQTLRSIRELTPASALLLDQYLDSYDTILEQGKAIEISRSEGKQKLVNHYIRERNPVIAFLAKQTRLANFGELRCEICGFSFSEVYGEIGTKFIEAHHKIPISKMGEENKTKIEDITLVCANCHRMLHKRNPCYTIEEIKEIISNQSD